ncbi:hydroxyproline dehydrogenase isoform X1 [Hydra vulgaris]|uniref:hydroxyproline dehydrogenase isoform X1 n=1 Tax=Hydra vulgaris TaxID=6087 RepID=UPI001F5EC287|nr:hydroxyproline dehydrogenase isoform X1 [Hydra vulgaris]
MVSKVYVNGFVDCCFKKYILNQMKPNRRFFCLSSIVSNDFNEKDYKFHYLNSNVFQSKSTKDLIRSFVVLKTSSIGRFVDYSERMFLIGEKIIWAPLFRWLMKSTYYGNFAAGETVDEAKATADKLKTHNVLTMLCVPIESKKFSSNQEAEFEYEKNFNTVLRCIEETAAIESNGFAQLKITALCDKELLVNANKQLEKYQYSHNEDENWDIRTVVDLIKSCQYSKIKLSGLSDESNKKFVKLLSYLDKLAQHSAKHGVRLMVDAEQTYMQATLNYLVLVLQAKYNKERHIVYNTYQCYRKDTFKRLQADHNLAKNLGFLIACKTVRGAYMVEEKHYANKNNISDPINETFMDTTIMYHSVVSYLLPYIANKEVSLMVASHNEDTVLFVKEKMAEIGLKNNDRNICFGQLYGMCDHVSYSLGKEGYFVYKSVPFGQINETLLYLVRRAHENKSVIQRTNFEILLIKKELIKRLMGVKMIKS